MRALNNNIRNTVSHRWNDSVIQVEWQGHTGGMTVSYRWNDSVTQVEWQCQTGGMTVSYRWNDSVTQMEWQGHTGGMTVSYRWNDSVTQVEWQGHTGRMTVSHKWIVIRRLCVEHLNNDIISHEFVCVTKSKMNLEMCANAQRDGRPAKHRWRPLFNAAKFAWCSLLDCRAVMLPRRGSRWK